jgi:hypothetical protein
MRTMSEWAPFVTAGVNILGMILVGLGFVYALRGRVDGLVADMAETKMELKALVALQVVQGRQEERILAVDQRVLAQGKRLDEFIRTQNERQLQMGRMVEAALNRDPNPVTK